MPSYDTDFERHSNEILGLKQISLGEYSSLILALPCSNAITTWIPFLVLLRIEIFLPVNLCFPFSLYIYLGKSSGGSTSHELCKIFACMRDSVCDYCVRALPLLPVRWVHFKPELWGDDVDDVISRYFFEHFGEL